MAGGSVDGVRVRQMVEADIAGAEVINRLAFGTFFGLPEPIKFRGDGNVVAGRRHADPEGAFSVELDGELVASGILMNWGSVGVLGPLTVHPDHWGKGIARHVMAALVDTLDRRGHRFSGLFTHPQSPSHIRLYEAYGYWMEMTTAVMSKPVEATGLPAGATLFSDLPAAEKERALASCRAVTDTAYAGLDVGSEIRTVADLDLGDTLLLDRDGETVGFAVCHHGPGSEAGSAQLRVKFGAVKCGARAADDFTRLLAACEGLAAARGAPRISGGTSSGRFPAYRIMQEAGFRTDMNGVIMLCRRGTGYNQPEIFVIDDWR